MTCSEYREFFSDLYDGELGGDLRGELEGHVASCAACRSEYEVFRRGLAALRSMGEVPASSGFAARVVAAVRQDDERRELYVATGQERPTTRRSAPRIRRRFPWGVPLAAAAAVAAFFAGSMLQKDAADRRAGSLQAEIDRLRQTGAPAAALPEGKAFLDGKIVPIEEAVASRLAKMGLVRDGSRWIDREIKQRLDRGEMLVEGRWVPAADEVTRRVEDWKKAHPTGPAPTEEEILAKLGLVRRDGRLMTREFAEAFDAGKLLAPDGRTTDRAELVARALGEMGLVQHEGQWMTAAEQSWRRAQYRVVKSEFISQVTPVSQALEDLRIGAQRTYKDLTLYPLVSRRDRRGGPAVQSLHEASLEGRLDLLDDYTALQIHVRNKGTSDVALLAGEVLMGGRHGRLIARDAVVPAGKTVLVDVVDAEPTVFRTADKFAKESGSSWAPVGIRRALLADVGQAGTWAALWSAVGSNAASVRDLYTLMRREVFEYRSALFDLRDLDPRVVGVAVAVEGRLVAAHVFGSPALFDANFDRVLDSAALEAVLAGQNRELRVPSNLPAAPESVKVLLESVFPAEHDIADGAVAVRKRGTVFGRGSVAGGELVHLAVYPEASPEIRPAGSVPAGKLKWVLDGFAVRVKQANPARRAVLAREMSMLPGDAVVDAMAVLAKDPDASTRRSFLEALALRTDAKAAKAVAKLLPEARKDLPLFGMMADAAARWAGEEGVAALMAEIDPKSLDSARAAAERIPSAVLALDHPAAVEKAVGDLIRAFEVVHQKCTASELKRDTDTDGSPFTIQTLEIITRVKFKGVSRISDYATWWADPANRTKFFDGLEGRRK